MTKNMHTPAAILGLDVELIDSSGFIRAYEMRTTGNEHVTAEDVASSLTGRASSLAEQNYLLGEISETRSWCDKVVECAVYFFGGDYPRKVFYDWTTQLQYGLGWGSIGGAWDQIDKLLAFPFDSLEVDVLGKCGKEFFVGLSLWWKDRSNLGWAEEIKKTRGAGSKYFHMLGDVVRAISDRNEDAMNESLAKCINQYFKSSRGDFEFPLTAVFLRNLAEHEGLNVVVPVEIDKYLFRLKEGN